MSTSDPAVSRSGRHPATKNYGGAVNAEPVLPTKITLRAWQARYGRWLVWSDAAVIAGVVALAQALRFGTVTGES
ncbi:hypothetical protein, partial [Microtetraspora sp. AC03309]|uniref:hypothetical protein n=1 Tax=Microtetraspora sp. AC03309 TaxID=2779376 RepID=UPI001E444C63